MKHSRPLLAGSLVLILAGTAWWSRSTPENPLMGSVVAQEPAPPVPAAVTYRPTAVPDRVILTWTGDPASTQAVTWRTDTSVTRAVAQFARASADPGFVKRVVTVPAETQTLKTDLHEALYHTAELTGLHPDTQYAYRVGDGTNWSEWFHFRTASQEPEPFSFIYFGDAQNDLKSLWSRVIRQAYSDLPTPRFLLHAGDLVNRGERDGEWGEWFQAGGWVNGMVPSIPTPGNHEYVTQGTRRALTTHWRPQFALPENGPRGLEESAYYLDLQGTRIIALNSNEKLAEQAVWLDGVLRDNPNRWTIVTFHHPVYSTARGRDNKALRELWKPIFDKYSVDLVLQGHDHTYGRSNLTSGMNVVEPTNNTVYVVSVSGPKMYRLGDRPWIMRRAEDTQLYQLITVEPRRLRYEARTATGELYDAFNLVKGPDGANRLVERVPRDVPERVRPSP